MYIFYIDKVYIARLLHKMSCIDFTLQYFLISHKKKLICSGKNTHIRITLKTEVDKPYASIFNLFNRWLQIRVGTGQNYFFGFCLASHYYHIHSNSYINSLLSKNKPSTLIVSSHTACH